MFSEFVGQPWAFLPLALEIVNPSERGGQPEEALPASFYLLSLYTFFFHPTHPIFIEHFFQTVMTAVAKKKRKKKQSH